MQKKHTTLGKIQHALIAKAVWKLGLEELPRLEDANTKTFQPTLYLMVKYQMLSPWDWKQKKAIVSPHFIQHSTRSASQYNKARKGNESYAAFGWEEMRLSPFADGLTAYTENPRRLPNTLQN